MQTRQSQLIACCLTAMMSLGCNWGTQESECESLAEFHKPDPNAQTTTPGWLGGGGGTVVSGQNTTCRLREGGFELNGVFYPTKEFSRMAAEEFQRLSRSGFQGARPIEVVVEKPAFDQDAHQAPREPVVYNERINVSEICGKGEFGRDLQPQRSHLTAV